MMRYCPKCEKNVLVKRKELDLCLLVVLCIFTGGLGAIIYLLIYYSKDPKHCVYCNTLCVSELNHSEKEISKETHHNSILVDNVKKQITHEIRYCPNCGVNLKNKINPKLNFCPYCGENLKFHKKSISNNIQCVICHEYVETNAKKIICSFCGSIFHESCATNWISKYNSCPMCQNQFVYPRLK